MKHYKIVLYLASIFLLQECLLRVCFPLPKIQNFNKSFYLPAQDDEINKYPIWYERVTYQSKPDTPAVFVHHLNGYGFRAPNWKINKSPSTTRLLFVGDSFVEGAMAQEGIPEAFAKISSSKNFEVLNMGMMGVGLDSYQKLIHDAVPLFLPDTVFLILYANDAPFKEARWPMTTYIPKSNNLWEPRLWSIFKLLKKGIPLPFRFRSARPLIPPIPSPANPWTGRSSQFGPHVRNDIARYMQDGTFNPFHVNWVLKEQYFLGTEANFAPYLQSIKKYVEAYGSQLVVCYIPSRNQVSTYYYPFERATCQIECPEDMNLTLPKYHIHRQHLNQTCLRLKLPFIDLTNRIKGHEQQGHHLYWNYDDHMRQKGYQVVAEEIYRQWQKSRGL